MVSWRVRGGRSVPGAGGVVAGAFRGLGRSCAGAGQPGGWWCRGGCGVAGSAPGAGGVVAGAGWRVSGGWWRVAGARGQVSFGGWWCRGGCGVAGQPRGLVAWWRVRGGGSVPGARGVVAGARGRVSSGGWWCGGGCAGAGQFRGLVASWRVRGWEKAAGPQGVAPREGRRRGVNRASKEDPTGDRLSKWSRASSDVTWHPTTVPMNHDHGASTSPNGASRSTRP